MFQKLPITAILVLALAGCGAGSGASEKAVAKDAEAVEASTDVAAQEMAVAESRNAATSRIITKPAVDTSQLRNAPTWVMQDLAGNMLKSEDLLGQVVLVDFWATWCGPCKRSIPHLMELEEEYKDRGLKVVGVALDRAGPRVVQPFVDHYKINYQIVLGTQKHAQDFGGVRGIPTAFIISQDGKIYRKIVGLVPKAYYEADIKALLGIS